MVKKKLKNLIKKKKKSFKKIFKNSTKLRRIALRAFIFLKRY